MEHRRRGQLTTVLAGLAAVVGLAQLPFSRTMAAPVADDSMQVEMDTVVSSADGTSRVRTERLTVTPGSVPGPEVRVDLAGARQRLHGVGASLTESSAVLIAGLPADERRALLEALFAPDRGGLSVLRVVIGASDFSLEHRSLADSAGPDPELTTFSIERDRRWVLPVLREILAINPDIEIVASPWSAPGWMKTTGLYAWGGLEERYEAAYARYLVAFVEAYRDEGVTVDWLTLQNEPSAVQASYPSMVMLADQQARLVRDHLGPLLVEAGLATRVLSWDHNWCDARPPGGCVGTEPTPFPLDVLAGTGGRYPLGGTAFHCYGGNQAAANELVHAAIPGLQLWHTECSGGTWQADPFGDTARLVVRDRNHWSNATLLWNLALDPTHGPHLGGCDTCRGVVTVDPASDSWTPEVDYDVLATVARFGPQGSGALATAVTGEVEATAVCSPDGQPAAIVWNPGDAATVTMTFGDLALPVELATRSLTAVQAPEGTTCTLAAWPQLPEPPDPSPTASTTAAPTVTAAVVPAFTG
ncbi:MAG: hypothetical protein KDB36_05210 [Acidimicrobiales bacterium]|nr:hypothetical protein [Acidimicrobiales bacterium]